MYVASAGQQKGKSQTLHKGRLHAGQLFAELGSLPNEVAGDLSEGLETPVQAIYLITLLGFLVVGAYLVVRQVLIRRELEDAAKSLGDRIRSGNASSEVTDLCQSQPLLWLLFYCISKEYRHGPNLSTLAMHGTSMPW